MKKSLLIMLFILVSLISRAQDIHFSQIFETPLLRNPALAGIFSGDIRLQSVYRSQWNNITDAYKTASGNIEYKVQLGESDDFLTLAGQFLYDRAGTTDLTSTHILPAINYHKSLSEERNMYLSLAFTGGYVQRSVDKAKITTNSQFNGSSFDPGSPTGEEFAKSKYSYFDGSAGLSFNSQIGENEDNNIYIGAAYHHFNKAKNIGFYSDGSLEMTPKWVGSVGVRMNMNDYSYFTIEGDYSKQGGNSEIIGGVLYTQKLDDPESPKYLFHAGSYIRMKDAIIPVVKIECRPLAFAVSYDANISGLKKVSTGRGGFELSLTWQKYLDRFNSSKNATRCPKF